MKEKARDLGLDDDERVTRSNGHRPRKSDWIQVVSEALEESRPTQADLIREGLIQGLNNDEIRDAVLEVYPDAVAIRKFQHTRINGVLGGERRSGSEWWMENRDKVCEHRPRGKYETPEEEEEEEEEAA